MNVAIIPARGGSKRIAQKNIRSFNGRPILCYSIEAARKSGLFERVLVSTDDESIAHVAEQCGAEIPFVRPKTLADDHTGVLPVIQHALTWLCEQGQRPDYGCLIYATAPLMQPEYLRQGLAMLEENRGKSFAISVTTFPFPIQRAVRLTGEGALEPFSPEYVAWRSQDLEEAYHDAAQFVWGRTEGFLQGLPLFSPHSLGVTVPRHLVQDIDTFEDFHRAELLHRLLAANDHG